MATFIEVWRSSIGISPEDFSLFTSPADNAPYYALVKLRHDTTEEEHVSTAYVNRLSDDEPVAIEKRSPSVRARLLNQNTSSSICRNK